MDSILATLTDRLAQTPASIFVQSVSWLVPAVQTVHLLAIAIVLSSAGMLVLRVLGLAGFEQSIVDAARRYLPWIWAGLAVLLMSGSVLIVGEPDRTLINPVFHWKMILVAAVATLTAIFHAGVTRQAADWDLAPAHRGAARLLAVGAFGVWLTIAVLGRWIAYV